MSTDLKNKDAEEKSPIQKRYDKKFNEITSDKNMKEDGVSLGDKPSAVDLAAKEKSAAEAKSADNQEGLYGSSAGNDKSVSGILKGLSGKKKGVAGGVGGITILIIIIVFPLIMGPLQFIHISQLLIPNFDLFNEMGEARTSRLVRYLWHGDSPERARLGIVGNRVADKIETRLLKHDGIKILKTDAGNRMAGIEVRGRVINIDAADIEKGPRNSAFRRALRAELKTAGYGKIASAIMTRPMFARYGVGLKPFGNVKKQVGEDVDSFRRRVRADNDTRIADGVTDTSIRSIDEQIDDLERTKDGSNDAEVQRQIDELRASAPELTDAGKVAQDVETSYKNTDGPESAKIKAAGDTLTKVGKGSAIIAAIGMSVCFTRNIAKTAPLVEMANKYFPMIRLGMQAISRGDQINTGTDVIHEEIEVAAENLSNEQGDWSAAEHINLLANNSFEGVSSEETLAIGGAAESSWVKAGEFLNLPGVDQICSLMGNVVFQGATAVVEFGLSLFSGPGAVAKVVATEAAQEAFSRLILSPLGASIIRNIAGVGIPSSIAGADYGNAIASGAYYAANIAAAEAGGVTLSAEEAVTAQTYIEESNPERFDERSLYDRYANINLPNSLLGSFAMKSYQTTSGGILNFNPVNVFSSFFSNITSFFTGGVTAADHEPYSGVGKVGYTVDEITSELADDPFQNEIELLDKYGSEEELAAIFGGCIPELPDPNVDPESDYFNVERPCEGDQGVDQVDLYKYRMYLLDQKLLLGLGCYVGDNASCSELGLDGTASAEGPQVPGTSIAGLVSPPNIATSPDQPDGYFRMPDSIDGSYIWNSATPPHSRCGSKALIDATYTVAQRWKSIDPTNAVRVGDLNEAEGHASHEHGVDVDIFMQKNDSGPYTFATTEDAIKLGRFFADTNLVKVILYNDPAVIADFNAYVEANGLNGEMKSYSGHGNHFHVRILDQYRGEKSAGCINE